MIYDCRTLYNGMERQFAMNMEEKMSLNDYIGDVGPLLRRGVTFNPHEAYAAFKETVLPLI